MEADGKTPPVYEPIRLQTYVDVLTETADGRIENIDHWEVKTVRRRAASELLRSGLLSDARSDVHFGGTTVTRRSAIVLTPEGAMALIQWRDFIRENRFWVRIVRGLYQWLLVLVGALAGGVSGVVATRFWPTQ